jgi:hypothetical protein
VKRKAPEEGHRTLGFKISVDGKCNAQKKAMKEKAILHGESIRSSTMWRGESGMAYNAFYMPSMGYGTPATILSNKDCEEIQRPVVNAILPKMGIARTAPRAIVFGTAQYGGLFLTHLAALQGHTRLQYLLGHLRWGNATGRIVQMLLEYTQLEFGCRGNPLAQDYNNYSALLINTNWITEVWEHLQTCKAKVEIDGLWQPTENRVRDIVIMESLIASGRFTNTNLKEINYCYIYLQVLYLSDITNIKVNKIAAWAVRGKKQYGHQSTWEWTVQQRPIAWKAWKSWKAALEYLAPDGGIGDPLGQWKSDHHQIMEWYFDAHSSALYHHIEGVWTRHDDMNIGRLRFRPGSHSCDEPNLCTHGVEVNERTRYMEIVRKYKIMETLTIETDHVITYTSGIGESCQALPKHIQRLVGNIPDLELLNGSEENEGQDLIVATDGSVVFVVGYHSWVVTTDNDKVLLKGGGPEDGDQLLMMSYRS